MVERALVIFIRRLRRLAQINNVDLKTLFIRQDLLDFLVLPQRNRLRIPRGKLCPFPDERDKKQSAFGEEGLFSLLGLPVLSFDLYAFGAKVYEKAYLFV